MIIETGLTLGGQPTRELGAEGQRVLILMYSGLRTYSLGTHSAPATEFGFHNSLIELVWGGDPEVVCFDEY